MKNATKKLSLVLVVIMVIMSLVTVNTDVFAETNVAQGKTATASSALSGYEAGKANDGDTASRWCASSASYPQWLRIDLGQNYSITSTSITFAPSGSTFKYKIEVSTDGSTFTTKTDKTSTNYTGTQNDSFTATARYIRITFTGSGTGDWASLSDVKVYTGSAGGGTNVAQGKTASASSVESGSPASNANDGNTSTSWCASSDSFNQWLKVDLGNANNSIESTSITFPSGQSFKYKIEVSSDGSSFTTKINKTSANYTGTQNDNFTASSVRYVMVTITGSGTSDWASIAEIKVMGTASGGPGNPEQNLLTGYDWSHFSGATVGTSGNVTITPIDRKIRPKTTGKWYLNPPINLAGPRLQFTGDFDVTAKMNITANPEKYAYLDLYGTVPICYDEWRIDGKNVRIGIKNGTIEVWINMAKQTYSKTGLSGTVTVSMRREGGILNFYVDGTKIGGSSDSVFTSGKLYIGADAEIGGGYSIDALTCAGASLTVADNYTELIKTYPAKAGSLRDYASQLSQPFWIGTAIQANALLSDPNYGKTLAEEFNMVTSEMDMKCAGNPPDGKPVCMGRC